MDLLKVLSNRTNQAILGSLRTEPSYARRTATLLGLSESEVTRRLRLLEKMGLVTGEWSHIGRNVKLYSLAAGGIDITFRPDGLHIDIKGASARSHVIVDPQPVQIPDPGEVVGRDPELAQLRAAPSAVVHGIAGIGKTSLLAMMAQDHAGPIFWHAFRGGESVAWLAQRVGITLARQGDNSLLEAVEAADPMTVRESLLGAMVRDDLLVIADDTHKIDDPAVEAVLRDAVVASPRVIAAGRRALAYPPSETHVANLEVGGLGREGTRLLLKHHDLDVDGPTLDAIMERIGGHPLAIQLVAEAVHRSEQGIADILQQIPPDRFDAYLLDEVDAHLSDEERVVLAAASVFRGAFTPPDVKAAQPRARQGLILRLRRGGLLNDRGDGRYSMHEVVRDHFRRRLDDPAPLHRRAAERFLKLGTIEGHLEALHHYLEAGHPDDARALIERNLDVRDFSFVDSGYARLYLRLLELVRDPDERLRAIIEDEKGDIWFSQGEFARAMEHYEKAQAYFDAHPESWEDEDVAWKRAMSLHHLGRSAEALAIVELVLPGAPEGRVRERLERLLQELR